MSIYVQFSDSTEQTIEAYFCGPQDSSDHPNQGALDAADARWKAFYDAMSPDVQPNLPAPE